jgi:hypothetical protein
MGYTGIILAESLDSEACLERIRIIKREIWDIADPAPYQPRTWTALSFEGDGDMAETARAISACLKPAWYVDMGDAEMKMIIYHDRVFSYAPGDASGRAEAAEHGRRAGIPERQLDWKE